jgi:hypothetical protein
LCVDPNGEIVLGFGMDYLPWLLKADSAGDSLWSVCLRADRFGRPNAIRAVTTGGYVVVGSLAPDTLSFRDDIWLAKVSATGDVAWQRLYGTSEGEQIGTDLHETSDGYFVTGRWQNVLGEPDAFCVLQTDTNGDTLWIRKGNDQVQEPAYRCIRGVDGGMVVGSKVWDGGTYRLRLRRLEGDSIQWASSFPLAAEWEPFKMGLDVDANGRFVLAGNTARGQIKIFKTTRDPALSLSQRSSPIASALGLDPVFPNPFNLGTQTSFVLPKMERVTLKVYDVLGREVATLVDGMMQAGEHEVTFDGRELPSGVYFCRLEAAGDVRVQKMVMLR